MEHSTFSGRPRFTGSTPRLAGWAVISGSESRHPNWPDRRETYPGRAFIDYLKRHDRVKDLAFFSFEHYPYDLAESLGAAFMRSLSS